MVIQNCHQVAFNITTLLGTVKAKTGYPSRIGIFSFYGIFQDIVHIT